MQTDGSPTRPIALAETVEEILRIVRSGKVRIPDFQRELNWKNSHVLDLFDSIYRGFPIGSFLFWVHPGKAARVRLGPLEIETPELQEAWWVVDGQQRLTALAAATSYAGAGEGSRFSVFFDPRSQTFENRHLADEPKLRVPVHRLMDSAELSEWLFSWPFVKDEDLRRAVFEAGKRLREYKIPFYLIHQEDESVLREIFFRTNNSGVGLKWEEIHRALFGGGSSKPSTLEDLGDELARLGMGTLPSSRAMACLVACRGGDPTRSPAEHYRRDPNLLEDAVREGVPTLRRVFSFLRQDAGIRHLRMLPRSHPLEILCRFFALHPEPSARTRTLLSRWLWRIWFVPPELAEATFRRRGIGLVDEEEEPSAQRILEMAAPSREFAPRLPASFDARESGSRLVVCALAAQSPRHLGHGRLLDLAVEIEEHGTGSFVHLFSRAQLAACPELYASPANRALHTPGRLESDIERCIRGEGVESARLKSHLLDGEVAEALVNGDRCSALELRAERLESALRDLANSRASWGHSDRPSIDFLLQSLGVGEGVASA